MRIVREEIFGPVLAVLKFKDEADAISLANDCAYGPPHGVFSKDGARALRVIRKLRADHVDQLLPSDLQRRRRGAVKARVQGASSARSASGFHGSQADQHQSRPGPVGWFRN